MKKTFCLMALIFCFFFSSGYCHEFGEWVNVHDGLPKVDKESLFLVYTEKVDPRFVTEDMKDYRIMLDIFFPDVQAFRTEYVNSQSGRAFLKVTHWMQLPEFPVD